MSTLKDVEVEVVEAVALGHGAGELVLADRALLEEHPLGRAAGGARGLDGGLHHLALGEAELDDDVGEEAAGAAAAAGRGDPVAALGIGRARERTFALGELAVPTGRRCGRFSESMGNSRRGGGLAGARRVVLGLYRAGRPPPKRRGGSRAGASAPDPAQARRKRLGLGHGRRLGHGGKRPRSGLAHQAGGRRPAEGVGVCLTGAGDPSPAP